MSAELMARTKAFAVRIIKFIQVLPPNDRIAQTLGHQLLRSATSIGANYRSALRGRSDKDFISRIGIAEEEAYETI
jgi:four helix bundle protein